ncbi:MAG: hypothetical protein ACUVYA_04365 [Planctomycetota bacterium]
MRMFLVIVLFAVPLVSCGGPERAPAQPIAGVDVSHREGANPHDFHGAGTTQPFLGNLVEGVVAAQKVEPGVVAVFPALSYDPDEKAAVVNGVGEHFARKTTDDLLAAGVSVLAGGDLVNSLKSAGFPLGAYRSVADALAAASQVKAAYVITGRVDRVVFDLARRDEALEIDWHCRAVKDGQIVARYRERLTAGPLAEELMRYYRLGSEWRDLAR